MIKKILKILLLITILFSFGINSINADNTTVENDGTNESLNQYDVKVNSDRQIINNDITNTSLDKLNGSKDGFINTNVSGEKGIYNFLIKAAQSLKNIFIAIATIYFLIIVLRLLFAEGSSDEMFEKFKNGVKWITIGIIVMQIAYSYVITIFNKQIGVAIVGGIIDNIIQPLIKLLETATVFFFIAIMIFSFYKIITAGGDEEKSKKGKMSIFYALIGFLVVRLSSFFVSAVYSKTLCNNPDISCVNEKELSYGAQIIFTVINWLNGFVGIVVVIMIIYTGSQIIFSAGEEEKIKKAKKSILYIFIGITILILNYFILTFFLTPELMN